jgi:ferritin-like metal-binding protein YciE
MADATLDTLFHDTLRDVLYAERKALQALKKHARAVKSPQLKQTFEQHREETEGQVERLQRVFETIGKRPQGKTCAAMDGIIEEADEIMDEYKGSPALDAGILAVAQAIEHYEITRYGTLAAWAKQLGNTEAEQLLRETLAEEEKTDKLLSELAEATINAAAESGAAA